MQRSETGIGCDLGRLEFNLGHESARKFFCGAGRGAADDCARVWTDHQHWFGDQRRRVCGAWAVWREPWRNPAIDDELGGRLGQAWRDGKLSGARMVSH